MGRVPATSASTHSFVRRLRTIPSLGGKVSSSGVKTVDGASELGGMGVAGCVVSVGDGVGIRGLSIPSLIPQAVKSKRMAENKKQNIIFLILIPPCPPWAGNFKHPVMPLHPTVSPKGLRQYRKPAKNAHRTFLIVYHKNNR